MVFPRYTEDLDTNYFGIYAAWGGDYSPFLFKDLFILHQNAHFFIRTGDDHFDIIVLDLI